MPYSAREQPPPLLATHICRQERLTTRSLVSPYNHTQVPHSTLERWRPSHRRTTPAISQQNPPHSFLQAAHGARAPCRCTPPKKHVFNHQSLGVGLSVVGTLLSVLRSIYLALFFQLPGRGVKLLAKRLHHIRQLRGHILLYCLPDQLERLGLTLGCSGRARASRLSRRLPTGQCRKRALRARRRVSGCIADVGNIAGVAFEVRCRRCRRCWFVLGLRFVVYSRCYSLHSRPLRGTVSSSLRGFWPA